LEKNRPEGGVKNKITRDDNDCIFRRISVGGWMPIVMAPFLINQRRQIIIVTIKNKKKKPAYALYFAWT
jgi:hypothetical protein